MILRMSDLIANFIKQAVEQEGGVVELQRAEIAQAFGCVPSQINYVLTSRFGPEMGYIVQSRRGGGGYIRVRRISPEGGYCMHVINSIGDQIDGMSCQVILQNLVDCGEVDAKVAQLILVATSDRSYTAIPEKHRDALRATLFKHLLLNI